MPDYRDGYHGAAVLIADDRELAVQVHLLADYQPVDGTVRWLGRVEPTAELRVAHRATNQAVWLRIGGRQPVAGLLLDNDPWGGSHVAGEGAFPYPHPLEAESSAPH